jgi:hypothetical protein
MPLLMSLRLTYNPIGAVVAALRKSSITADSDYLFEIGFIKFRVNIENLWLIRSSVVAVRATPRDQSHRRSGSGVVTALRNLE